MKVLMVTRHGCIRVFKEAYALSKLGYQVDVAHHSGYVPMGANKFTNVMSWFDADHLRRIVAASTHDIIHVHNEPDWMVRTCREAQSLKPIVYDCHDPMSLITSKEPSDDEKDAHILASAVVHVSEECRHHARNMHGYSDIKPDIVLHTMVNEDFVPRDDELPSVRNPMSIVYEGGLKGGDVVLNKADGITTISYRTLHDVVDVFKQRGYEFWLFSAMPIGDGASGYIERGAVVLEEMEYLQMLRALRMFNIGFVGSPVPAPIMNAAMPNKLFEYISQGVVPVVINADAAGRFVTKHGVGIHIHDPSELDTIQDRVRDCRSNLMEMRHKLTMEHEIGRLVSLYEALV